MLSRHQNVAWEAILHQGNEELEELANKVVSCLETSKSSATIKTYIGAWKQWERWCAKFKFEPLPSSPDKVALFAAHKTETCKSSSAVITALYAISWVHKTGCYPDPTDNVICKAIIESRRRSEEACVMRKKPLPLEELLKIVEACMKRKRKALAMRLAVFVVLGYSGFLRANEALNLKVKDITFRDEHMAITIQKAKNDVYREGKIIKLARNNLCDPVKLTKSFMNMTGISNMPESYIFSAIKKPKAKSMAARNKPLAYSTINKQFKDVLVECGLNPKEYGLHSLRSGGATRASNAGVEDRLLKRHGRWKSEKAKNMYIQDSLDRSLSVSKKLFSM